MLSQIINFIVETVSQLGYAGIFIMMFLESSFFPFPSEVVMIPAGYLAYKGEMNMYLVILFGILGSLAGALFNYYLALKLGRRFLMRYGKYILISEDTILKMEDFFNKIWKILFYKRANYYKNGRVFQKSWTHFHFFGKINSCC